MQIILGKKRKNASDSDEVDAASPPRKRGRGTVSNTNVKIPIVNYSSRANDDVDKDDPDFAVKTSSKKKRTDYPSNTFTRDRPQHFSTSSKVISRALLYFHR